LGSELAFSNDGNGRKAEWLEVAVSRLTAFVVNMSGSAIVPARYFSLASLDLRNLKVIAAS
jgi:hypothetical protein